MQKKFLGKNKIGNKSWIYYYVTKRMRNVYGIFILSSQEKEGENKIEWDWIDGLTESENEAETIGLQCKKYMVTPINIAESLDEILEKFKTF
ncbi:MAG: DUF6514 family protein [Lachnospiraceae bacterium]